MSSFFLSFRGCNRGRISTRSAISLPSLMSLIVLVIFERGESFFLYILSALN